MTAEEAFETWWNEQSRLGDPARRTNLARDAFLAAFKIGRSAYRCYSCKQVFEEDHGHGLAREHFGSHLKGDQVKCHEVLSGKATWGGGPHDPFYRVRKDYHDALEHLCSVVIEAMTDANQLVMLCAVGETKAATDLTSRFAKVRAAISKTIL